MLDGTQPFQRGIVLQLIVPIGHQCSQCSFRLDHFLSFSFRFLPPAHFEAASTGARIEEIPTTSLLLSFRTVLLFWMFIALVFDYESYHAFPRNNPSYKLHHHTQIHISSCLLLLSFNLIHHPERYAVIGCGYVLREGIATLILIILF
jgi:hypothetical protein